MVKQYSQLYQDTRRALLATEDAQDAGVLARMLVCHYSGKARRIFWQTGTCMPLKKS